MKDILEKIYNEEENIFYSILEDLLTTNKKYRNQQEQKMEFVAALYSFIQEYVDLAYAFFTKNEPKMVNALLDQIAHAVRN